MVGDLEDLQEMRVTLDICFNWSEKSIAKALEPILKPRSTGYLRMQPYANSLLTSICHDGSQTSEPVEEADQCANLSEHHELHALQTGRSGPRGKTIMATGRR
jgi:hypothetical protein